MSFDKPAPGTRRWMQELNIGLGVTELPSSRGVRDHSSTVTGRDECRVPVKVATSPIKDAGRGLVVEKKVDAGRLIISIKSPLVSMVGSRNISEVCESCFTANIGGTCNIVTMGTAGVPKFSKCGGCKIVYYCSKTCQKEGWKHDHKYECKAFQEIQNEGTQADRDLLLKDEGRLMLRLLLLHKNTVFSTADWEALTALQPAGAGTISFSPQHDKSTAKFAARYSNTTLTEDEISHLSRIAMNNEALIRYPFLNNNPQQGVALIANTSNLLSTGRILDPFIALINHSCDPNSRFISEGAEFCVRSIKDIAAGEELTVSYGPTINVSVPTDHKGRQEFLKREFGFTCTCTVCKLGQLGPRGELRRNTVGFLGEEPSLFPRPSERDAYLVDYATRFGELFQASELSNIPRGAYPWLAIYRKQMHLSIIKSGDPGQDVEEMTAALKVAIKIYFYLEPTAIEAVDVDDRLALLSTIIMLFLQLSLRVQTLDALPSTLSTFKKNHGPPAAISFFENRMFEVFCTDAKESKAAQGLTRDYVSLQDSAEERIYFEKKMTELASWADLPKWTLIDYMEEWQLCWRV